MFGLSLKDRAEEALKRGTKAALTGGFFHYTEVEKFALNEEASGYLYTEGLAHQIYSLVVAFKQALYGKKSWANQEFVMKVISNTILEHELASGLAPSSISSFVFRRCTEIDYLSPQERYDGKQFYDSSDGVIHRDSSANKEAIKIALQTSTYNYMRAATKMFAT